MKKAWKIWLISGLVTVNLLGGGLALAADKDAGKNSMPGHGQMMGNMDHSAMADKMKSPDMQKHCMEMMKSPEMQKHCMEMMKSPEMQQAMMGMMKQPEMQAMMKQMLQKDAGFHQMMLDLVNSVDMNSDHNHGPMSAPSATAAPADHSSHHK